MKHVVLAWQCFQKLTDARGAFTHSPCVYVQIDSNSGPVRIGKASKHSCPNWLLKIRNLDSIQFAVSAPSGSRRRATKSAFPCEMRIPRIVKRPWRRPTRTGLSCEGIAEFL